MIRHQEIRRGGADLPDRICRDVEGRELARVEAIASLYMTEQSHANLHAAGSRRRAGGG
jgi:hypothetical protein